MQAQPQRVGELDQVGDRGRRLSALELRQKAFGDPRPAGHMGERQAGPGPGGPQAMADVTGGFGDALR